VSVCVVCMCVFVYVYCLRMCFVCVFCIRVSVVCVVGVGGVCACASVCVVYVCCMLCFDA
jgi:hypothetical protein